MRESSTGYFLCADILGFSDIVESQSPHKLDRRLDRWIDTVESLTEKYALIRRQYFSDTLFVSTDSSCHAFCMLLQFARSLLEEGIRHRFPVRGGIAYGEVVWDDTITFGRAVLEAYRIEQESDWIGIACSSTCCHTESAASWDLLVKYLVPQKRGPATLSSVVAWCVPPASELEFQDYTKAVNTALFGKYLNHGREQGYDPKCFPYESSILKFIEKL